MLSKNIFNYILIFIFAFIVTIVPWDVISNSGRLTDRDNYFDSYLYRTYKLDIFEPNTILDYFTYEFGWYKIISIFRDYFLISPTWFFSVVTFVSVSVFCFYAYYKTNSLLVLFYFLNPLFISLIYSQMRLSFALTIFIISTFFFYKKLKYISFILFIFAASIHTSIILFLLMISISYYISIVKFNNLIKFFTLMLSGFIVFALIGPLRYGILEAIGDRRAEYQDMSDPFLYLLFFLFYFILLFFSNGKMLLKKVDYNYCLILLALTFFCLMFGGYLSRILAASSAFIFSTVYYLKNEIKVLVNFGFLIYYFSLWYIYIT